MTVEGLTINEAEYDLKDGKKGKLPSPSINPIISDSMRISSKYNELKFIGFSV